MKQSESRILISGFASKGASSPGGQGTPRTVTTSLELRQASLQQAFFNLKKKKKELKKKKT